MSDIEVVENGLVELLKSEPQLSVRALSRLRILQAEVNAATKVAQAAINEHQTIREAYEQAFTAACEDYGIEIPPGPHDVDINWISGQVNFRPKVGP